MNLLLDTHIFAWWICDGPELSKTARAAIVNPDNRIFVSVVTAFEMATKHRLGKWDGIAELIDEFESVLREQRFEALPIGIHHSRLAGLYKAQHRDPFDRLLAAQAKLDSLVLVTADKAFKDFDVNILV